MFGGDRFKSDQGLGLIKFAYRVQLESQPTLGLPDRITVHAVYLAFKMGNKVAQRSFKSPVVGTHNASEKYRKVLTLHQSINWSSF